MMWRPLTDAEITQLIQQNNSADDWKDISVVRTFSVLNIRNCHFSGHVKIEENVSMSNVRHIENYHIGANAKLANTGSLTFTEEHYGYRLELCNEDGRFQVVAVPEMNSTGKAGSSSSQQVSNQRASQGRGSSQQGQGSSRQGSQQQAGSQRGRGSSQAGSSQG